MLDQNGVVLPCYPLFNESIDCIPKHFFSAQWTLVARLTYRHFFGQSQGGKTAAWLRRECTKQILVVACKKTEAASYRSRLALMIGIFCSCDVVFTYWTDGPFVHLGALPNHFCMDSGQDCKKWETIENKMTSIRLQCINWAEVNHPVLIDLEFQLRCECAGGSLRPAGRGKGGFPRLQSSARLQKWFEICWHIIVHITWRSFVKFLDLYCMCIYIYI